MRRLYPLSQKDIGTYVSKWIRESEWGIGAHDRPTLISKPHKGDRIKLVVVRYLISDQVSYYIQEGSSRQKGYTVIKEKPQSSEKKTIQKITTDIYYMKPLFQLAFLQIICELADNNPEMQLDVIKHRSDALERLENPTDEAIRLHEMLHML